MYFNYTIDNFMLNGSGQKVSSVLLISTKQRMGIQSIDVICKQKYRKSNICLHSFRKIIKIADISFTYYERIIKPKSKSISKSTLGY